MRHEIRDDTKDAVPGGWSQGQRKGKTTNCGELYLTQTDTVDLDLPVSLRWILHVLTRIYKSNKTTRYSKFENKIWRDEPREKEDSKAEE